MRACRIVRGRARHACDCVNWQMTHPLPAVIVARVCVFVCEYVRALCVCACAGSPLFSECVFECVECLIGKQKKPILFKVTEPSSTIYLDQQLYSDVQ